MQEEWPWAVPREFPGHCMALLSTWISIFPLSPFPDDSRVLVLCHSVLLFQRAIPQGSFRAVTPDPQTLDAAELLLIALLLVPSGCKVLVDSWLF